MQITLNAYANLSVAEAAALLGCSEAAIRGMIHKADLKAHRYTPGGHFYIPLPEVMRLLNEDRQTRS